MSHFADTFIQRLQQLERERNVDALVSLFADDAELRRAPRAAHYRGTDGARTFWAEYLDAFQDIETRFEAVSELDGKVVLEWHSRATTKQGHAIEYDGCSIVEGDGERVHRFRTYYDAAASGMGGAAQRPGTSD